MHRQAAPPFPEGDGTDHASALSQALEIVRAGKPDKKIVFLLTDGNLDVSESTNYQGQHSGTAQRGRPGRGKRRVDDLDGTGTQVWPPGFGKSTRTRSAGPPGRRQLC